MLCQSKELPMKSSALFLAAFAFLTSAFADPTYSKLAILAAQEKLPENSFHIVPDKFSFLQEISQKPDCEDTFHVVDVGALVDRLTFWQQHLPTVRPHYAIKTNNDPIIASVLAKLSMGFDCASTQEIEQVLQLGVSPANIIYAHPRKTPSSILYAKEHGVDLFTFDSLEELDKMLTLYPEAKLLLRIKTDDTHSVVPLSAKFGATMEEAYEILAAGFTKKAHIIGIAFHVGSNCTHVESYQNAILDAAALFRYSKMHLGREMTILDLGGGWPGTYDDSFVAIAKSVNELIQSQFTPETHVIAEPGRYFSAQTTTMALRVVGKKHLSPEDKIAYYLTNGVYGFFMSSLYYEYNHAKILTEGWNLKPLFSTQSDRHSSLLWGPTCDPGDKLFDAIMLPEIATGDFLTVENVGAYSKVFETNFNGITPSKAYYIYDTKSLTEIQ